MLNEVLFICRAIGRALLTPLLTFFFFYSYVSVTYVGACKIDSKSSKSFFIGKSVLIGMKLRKIFSYISVFAAKCMAP